MNFSPMRIRLRSFNSKPLQLMVGLISLLCISTIAIAQNMPVLVSLAKGEDWQQLHGLLEDGLDPNASYNDGSVALHWASYHDNKVAAHALVNAGADVNYATDLGVTALWLAAENGSTEMTRLLLEAGADPNIPLFSGESIVMTAAQSGDAEVVRALLEAGADPNIAATRQQTALMWAANEGHHEAVAQLIAHGADIHAHSLVRTQYVKSEKEQDSSDDYKYWIEEGGNTPLLFAARAGDLISARHIVKAGADVNEGNAFGDTPLIIAVHAGNLELVRFLIESGAEVNDSRVGHTALHAAVLRGNLEAVKTLISAGANLESLVEKPTPVRRQTTDYHFHNALIGASSLWLAARFAEPEIMRTLIDAGANVHKTNHVSYPEQRMGENFIVDEGEISLVMAAVGMGHYRLRTSWWTAERRAGQLLKTQEDFILEAVTVALQAGVDPNSHNNDGETALSFARGRRYSSVVTLLEEIGAQ